MRAAWLTLAVLSAALAAPPSAETARLLLGRPVAEAVGAWQQWELADRDGIGLSDATTSGDLGWGEATYLRNFLSCWLVTGEPYWLDRFMAHYDRMLRSQHDRNQDGFLAWDSVRYSVGLVKVAAATGAEGLTLTPELQRENATGNGIKVTGRRYAVLLPTAETLRLIDLDRDEVLVGNAPYRGVAVIDLFAARVYPSAAQARAAGATTPLTLQGTGRAGAQFQIETTAPEWIEFVVHDGMVTYPLAQFIEAVYTTPGLEARYRAAADRYLTWFHRHIYEKWEPCWRQVDAAAGAYSFTKARTERYPGYLLPHNQYLALARAYLVLQAVEGVPHRDLYRQKAQAMATYFQRFLRPTPDGQAVVWNYWDPPEHETVRRSPEDHSHATIDVGFVAEAARRQVVLTAADAQRMARTYTAVMSNGDAAHPKVSLRVDGSGDQKNSTWWDWALLGEFDEAALRQAAAIAAGSVAAGPQLAEVVARLGGVTAADRAAARHLTAQLQEAVRQGGNGNSGFEHGTANGPYGWTFATWSREGGAGRFEWSTDAVEGQRSVALIGTSGTPNLVLERAPLELPKPVTLTITLQYKTAGDARPYLSFIAPRPGGERQYDNSPTLAPAATWQRATWTVKTAAGATTGRLYLRNSGRGTVWFDDLRIEPAP